MEPITILIVILILLVAIHLAFQIFKMVELDAISRGFKQPKLWGLFATGGQNNSGLIIYLLARRKYISTMSIEDKAIMASRKKKVMLNLIIISVLAILFAGLIIF